MTFQQQAEQIPNITRGWQQYCCCWVLDASYSRHLYAQSSIQELSMPCRCLYVRNLPFNISSDEMYEIFGRYGAVRQIRQ